MLATWTTPTTRGKVYGFHRAMDHLGAVIGPAAATLFLWWYPGAYRMLFALTIVPGAIAVLLILFIKERDEVRSDVVSGFSRTYTPTPADAPLPRRFNLFMLVLALFTLGNSSDAFLLLKLTDVAGSVKFIPLMWSALHVVKATVSVFGGDWSDRVGRRTVIAIGWLVYAAVYVGFAVSASLPALLGWFLVYGVYFGFTEGTEKALVADLAPASRRGLAFGVYNAVLGLGGLVASIAFGLVWKAIGPAAAFSMGAGLALVSAGLLFVVVPPRR
jgi:MFS family permease